MKKRPYLHRPLLGALLLLLTIASLGAQAMAQTNANDSTATAENWARPQNLSMSGAASNPAIVLVPDGTLRVFWWDQFDGTLVSDGILAFPAADGAESGEPEAWSSSIRATIQLSATIEIEGENVTVRTPIETAPRIIGDASGRAYAFWLGEPDEESGETSLLYSRLNAGSTRWSVPSGLATSAGSFAVAADRAGDIHLVYVQVEPAPGLDVGLYYRRLPARGSSWSGPSVVHISRYMRLLSPGEDSLRLTANDGGNLYTAWEGPDRGQIMVAHSADGGVTWSEPEAYLGSGVQPQQDRVIALPNGAPAVLWTPASAQERRIAASSSGSTLRLAAWDGVRWLETAKQPLNLEDPESGEQVQLHDLSMVLVPPSATEEEAIETLAVMGLDDRGDLWITGAKVDSLERLLDRPDAGEDISGAAARAPLNLSKSGIASDPAIVVGSSDRLYAFWQDRFDGLTVADAFVVASTVLSGTEEITTSHETWSEPRAVPILLPETSEGGVGTSDGTPVEGVPQIEVDASGGIHAFWSAGPEGEASTLMYSQLAQDASAWSSPAELAELAAAYDVAADSSGGLHIAYIEASTTSSSPAGIYYRRLEQGRTYWTAPIPLQQSRYFRLLTPEAAHLRLAAEEAGTVYVTWDDPEHGGLVLAQSSDRGVTWQETAAVGSVVEGARRGRLVPVPQGDTLMLWVSAGSVGSCSLSQATVQEVLEAGIDAGRPVLESLGTCPEGERFVPLGENQVLMVLGSGSDALTLAVWDGSQAGRQWSEPSRLAFSFEDAASNRRVYLGDLHVALVETPDDTNEGLSGMALVVVGIDQEGDVWATSSETGALDVVFATPSPWSSPVEVSLSEAHPDLPAMAVDGEGRVHALWAEAVSATEPGAGLMYARWDGEAWTQPAPVLESPEGGSGEPDLVAQGDRLHAVWSSQDGKILTSAAFAQDAYAAGGWSEPMLLSAEGSFATDPDLVGDAAGGIHAVFAVPVNEGRGIYYTHSADGETWTPLQQVFDAAAAGWIVAGQPQLAVDEYGFLHVAWVRTLPSGSASADGIYYARSLDGGQTWSEPLDAAIGSYGWPQVMTTPEGRVHLVWQELSDQNTWLHRYSPDAGETWTTPERIAGFQDVGAPVKLMGDGGALHLVGLRPDEEGLPALLYTTWDGSQWSSPEAYRLEMDGVEAGISAAIVSAQRRLDVLYRGEGWGQDNTGQAGLWHTGRELPAVAVTPAPAFVPPVAATPLATPSPMPSATPVPDFSGASPASGGDSDLFLPILLAGGGALLIVGAAAGARALRQRRR